MKTLTNSYTKHEHGICLRIKWEKSCHLVQNALLDHCLILEKKQMCCNTWCFHMQVKLIICKSSKMTQEKCQYIYDYKISLVVFYIPGTSLVDKNKIRTVHCLKHYIYIVHLNTCKHGIHCIWTFRKELADVSPKWNTNVHVSLVVKQIYK